MDERQFLFETSFYLFNFEGFLFLSNWYSKWYWIDEREQDKRQITHATKLFLVNKLPTPRLQILEHLILKFGWKKIRSAGADSKIFFSSEHFNTFNTEEGWFIGLKRVDFPVVF